MDNTKQKILNDFINDEHTEKYISWQGKTCYKTTGLLNYYFLLCQKLNLKIKAESAYSYEATDKQKTIRLSWVEHDIILNIKG